VRDELEKIQKIQHNRKHSRSSSVVENAFSIAGTEDVTLNLAKVHFIAGDEGEVVQSRMIMLDEMETFDSLNDRVKEKFGKAQVKLKYRDSDGDLITMCEDSDLIAAYESARLVSGSLKLVIWCYSKESE
jgi:hypothetical protein